MRRLSAPAALLAALFGGGALGATSITGGPGGTLVVAQTSEPKTFNPATPTDQPTRDVLSVISADLVHINRQKLEPGVGLPRRCDAPPDGRHHTITFPRRLAFSDRAP